MKLRRVLSLGLAVLLVLLVFTIDVIRKNVSLDTGGLKFVRDLMVIGSFVLTYLLLELSSVGKALSPLKKLGMVMIAVAIVLIVGGTVSTVGDEGFEAKGSILTPLGYGTIFAATFVSVLIGVFAVFALRLLRDLVMFKRKRWTERNFRIFGGLTLAASASTLLLDPLDSSILTGVIFGFAVLLAVVNSFRVSWIVYLTKREKIFSLIYGFLLFLSFIALNILLHSAMVQKSLHYYSYPLWEFVQLTGIFGGVYFGMTFISTLFHLPTAEAFERKTSEISSLHNLGKLITQVFDFDELVDTVTSMTLQVCEAKSCWLEIIRYPEEPRIEGVHGEEVSVDHSALGRYHVQVVASKNITQNEIRGLFSPSERTLRDVVLVERKPVLVDDVAREPRLSGGKHVRHSVGSLVVVPLVSHGNAIGVLYATKETPYGFFKDDVDVISAFADQATIAIENSRLIEKSLERERLVREMLLAQEMQRKLLPQVVPQFPHLDVDAISNPAFEVGGDYYDFVTLRDNKLGIVVGDVSGKGVSAAFYMSEVKGIFQALSRLYPSPKEFMVKANEALAGSIDKHSFISLLYAVVDLTTGVVCLARAGHCPMLLVTGEQVAYIRPTGIGLGLSDKPLFAESMEEQSVQLRPGDVCVLYTDGITEARRGDEEFGYDRLLKIAADARHKNVSEIKQDILTSVKNFLDQEANEDDLTLVVLKWRGAERTGGLDVS